jgi:hypothetical protein
LRLGIDAEPLEVLEFGLKGVACSAARWEHFADVSVASNPKVVEWHADFLSFRSLGELRDGMRAGMRDQ